MADPIDPITANPDTNNIVNFAAQADLAWSQLKGIIPQINAVATAMNLNSVSDTSITSNVIGNGLKTFEVSAGKSFLKGQVLNVADTLNPADNFMTAVVTDYSGTALSVMSIQFMGSGTKEDWTISLSAAPSIPTVTSELKVTTLTGKGSTNTQIYKFGSIAINTATADLAFNQSATLGDNITVLSAGWYRVRSLVIGTSSPRPGITLNCTQLSSTITTLTSKDQLLAAHEEHILTISAYVDTVVYLRVNDILRMQDGSGILTLNDSNSYLLVQKVSLQGVGGSGGGGGGGAPTDAEYVTAISNGSLTNQRVITTSNTNIVDIGTAGQVQIKRAEIIGDINIPANGNTATIQNNTVTAAKMADMQANTVKVNNTAATGDPVDLVIPPSTVLGRDATGNILPLTMGANMSIVAGALTSAGGGGGGGAPTTAQYIVAASDATLTAERVATSGTSVTVDIGTAGQAIFKRAALTGDVTASADNNVTTIANDSVTNAKLANMAANTVKVNNTAATGDPVDLALSAESLVGRGETGNVAVITLGPNLTMTGNVMNAVGGITAGDLTTAGVVIYDSVNSAFKTYAGTDIILGTNPVYTWAAKPAANTVSAGTHIRINPSSFGGTHKTTIGPTAVSDGTRWLPAGGKQLLCRGSSSVASPLATASGATATAFNIAAHFSLPAGFFEYAGVGLEVIGLFQKTGADANASGFTIRCGTLASAGNDSVVGVTTTAAANREALVKGIMRVNTLGAANTAVFTSGPLQPNASNANLLTDKSSNVFDTTAVMYVVPAAICSANAAATHTLIEYEIWWVQ